MSGYAAVDNRFAKCQTRGDDGLGRRVIPCPSVYVCHRRPPSTDPRPRVRLHRPWPEPRKPHRSHSLPAHHLALARERPPSASSSHGFSAPGSAGTLYADYVPAATYDGANFVLDGQAVPAALEGFARFKDDQEAELLLNKRYLRRLAKGSIKTKTEDWRPEVVIEVLERRAKCMVRERAKRATDSDTSSDHRIARAVTDAFVIAQVGEIVRG